MKNTPGQSRKDKMDNHERPFGFWVQDSYGKHTFHKNGSNLSFKDSLIGSLAYDRDAESNKQWKALDIEDKEIGSGTLYQARSLVEKNVRNNKPQAVTYSPAPRK